LALSTSSNLSVILPILFVKLAKTPAIAVATLYDVRYMTSDERQDWIEHLLSDADVTAAHTPTPDVEAVESPPKGASEAEEDFTSHSG
jgi:hypothetical protein